MGAIFRTLRSAEENRGARAELERRGLSLVRRDLPGRLGRMLGVERLSIGDLRKSWDVLTTVAFIEARLPKDAPIIDFGAYRSEITGVLSRLGYQRIHGVDRNPAVLRGPDADRVRYTVGDFLATGLAPGTFAAVTAISAIEHGHSLERLLAEVGRLLRPGGYFLASTDYWPEKIDTSGIRLFGLEWTIFSAEEVRTFFESASRHGLVPAGSVDYSVGDSVIHYAGKRYTFAWLALRKEESR